MEKILPKKRTRRGNEGSGLTRVELPTPPKLPNENLAKTIGESIELRIRQIIEANNKGINISYDNEHREILLETSEDGVHDIETVINTVRILMEKYLNHSPKIKLAISESKISISNREPKTNPSIRLNKKEETYCGETIIDSKGRFSVKKTENVDYNQPIRFLSKVKENLIFAYLTQKQGIPAGFKCIERPIDQQDRISCPAELRGSLKQNIITMYEQNGLMVFTFSNRNPEENKNDKLRIATLEEYMEHGILVIE